ncbi:MAG: cation:proton antiporter [SAR324 cluster bacterium]|nr:cation:proton antiporter [SAR324 cluster bacterium]
MKLLFAIVIIAGTAIIGTRVTFRNRQLPMGFRNILLTGIEYLFLGVVLGKMGLNVIDSESLDLLQPFLLFGLSWIGFLFGLQFEFRLIKNLPRFYFSITAVKSVLTFLTVAIPLYYLLDHFISLPKSILLLASITLGSIASCTAQSALAIVSQNTKIKNRGMLELLRYISSVDGLFSLMFFTFALSIIPSEDAEAFSFLASAKLLLASVSMGIVPAIILISLSKTRFSQQEFLVFIIGIVMLCGGLAHQIHHSPLLSGLICGMVTANFCRYRVRALSTVIHSEKSIYIILLIFVGAGWQISIDYSLVLATVYFILRIFGKLFSTFAATQIFPAAYHVPKLIGMGLLSEGGLAIAIVLNFRLLYPAIADSLSTIIIISVILNELISPWLILKLLDQPEPAELPIS